MGKLFPYAKGRLGAGESAIAHFREAAKADSSSSLVWEMLGEMLALSDPPGQPHAHPFSQALPESTTSSVDKPHLHLNTGASPGSLPLMTASTCSDRGGQGAQPRPFLQAPCKRTGRRWS